MILLKSVNGRAIMSAPHFYESHFIFIVTHDRKSSYCQGVM